MNQPFDNETDPTLTDLDAKQCARRDFLLGLGRWSKAAIAAAVLGGLAVPGAEIQAGTWANRRGVPVRGGSWVNRGGGSWANRRGGVGWVNVR